MKKYESPTIEPAGEPWTEGGATDALVLALDFCYAYRYSY